MAFVTSIPQLHLSYVRGAVWNGSCYYSDWDELPYAAYTNALIQGRPRRNDPFSGKDDGQFESLFSIQFLPAYVVAIPARFFRVSVDTAFMLLLPLATITSFLAIWWLLFELTGNAVLSTVGAACVISLGTAAAHSPIPIFFGVIPEYSSFPFLRRYIPAAPFPVFLLSSLFIWRALLRSAAWALLAGVFLIILIYSYFFLWTALTAWFLTVLGLWFVFRPQDRGRVWRVLAGLVVVGITGAIPYIWLLTQRPQAMDRSQVLEFTHAPDLFRAPELYGALILCVLTYLSKKKRERYDDPKTLFAASFALVPFLLFNQQVVTGTSLQPFHYEEFVANYWIVLAGVLTLGLFGERITKRVIIYLAVGSTAVAVLLAVSITRLMDGVNIRFDQIRPAILKVNQQKSVGVVFATDGFLTHHIPTLTNYPVLWARYLYAFSNVDPAEQRRRYYAYMYYSGFDENRFLALLSTDFIAQWEVFGPNRVNSVLTSSHQPITNQEITNAASEYGQFVRSFDSKLAMTPVLSYAVVSANDDLSNIDKWYERNAGEPAGPFVIYTLKPKLQVLAASNGR